MTKTAKGNNEAELMEVIRNYGIDIEKLEKKLATAVEALKKLNTRANNGDDVFWNADILNITKPALAEIGVEDE